MGCDIHLHQEIKINGNWEHYGMADVPRDYRLFAKMAGVRGSETPIALPRGLPACATAVTRFHSEHFGTDGHSHSWLDADEIYELIQWMKSMRTTECMQDHRKCFGFLFGNTWEGFKRYPDDVMDGLDDIRFVFWFDN